MSELSRVRPLGVVLLVLSVVLLGAVPGVAAAETRGGGSVVVAEGETVEGLTAFGGTVIVRGTVSGDLEAFAGNVVIEGEVTGDVSAFSGNVQVSGEVGGDLSTAGGSVSIDGPASIGGDLDATGGTLLIAGTVRGNVAAAGGSVTLAESATVDGNVEYDVGDDGTFSNQGATVGGTVERNTDLQTGSGGLPEVPSFAFDIYGLLVTLGVGALLLSVFPDFSRSVARQVADDSLRTGGIGLLSLVGVPVALVLVAFTVIGIPVTIAGTLAFALILWIATIYGRFAVGAWILSLADVDNRWAGLLVGVLVVAALTRVPFVGGIAELVVLLLGLGALATLWYGAYKRRGSGTEGQQATLDETAGG